MDLTTTALHGLKDTTKNNEINWKRFQGQDHDLKHQNLSKDLQMESLQTL